MINHECSTNELSGQLTKHVITAANRSFNRKPMNSFDDRVLAVLQQYEKTKGMVESTREYLNRIGFSYAHNKQSLYDALENYRAPHAPSFQWNDNYKRAKQQVDDEMRKYMVRHAGKVIEYRSESDLIDNTSNLKASAGVYGINNAGPKKLDNTGVLFAEFEQILTQARKNQTFDAIIMPAVRHQISGGFNADGSYSNTFKQKTRLVHVVSFEVIAAETMFFKPIFDGYRQFPWYSTGKSSDQLEAQLRQQRDTHTYWTSIDYSQYDASLPDWLIRDAFDLLYEVINPMLAAQHRDLWKTLVQDFVVKTVIGEDGQTFILRHGVPSGSMFTNLIDSLCNYLMMLTYINSQGVLKEEVAINICGDDNLIFTNSPFDMEDFLSYVKHNFGVTGSADKCSHGTSRDDNPEYLSTVWTKQGRWRQPEELISKLLYPEYFRDYDRKGFSPLAVVLSYVLQYPTGMDEVLNLKQFFEDNWRNFKDFADLAEHGTGVVRYIAKYVDSNVYNPASIRKFVRRYQGNV